VHNRLLALALATALAALFPTPAPAQDRAPSPAETISPSDSPSPGARRGDRARSPRFVLLLVVLTLGLLWQVQRARRTTERISERSIEDLERATRLEPPPRE
jgi:hypothetical protein